MATAHDNGAKALPPAGYNDSAGRLEEGTLRPDGGVVRTVSTYTDSAKNPQSMMPPAPRYLLDYSRELKAVQREQVANPAPLGLLGFALTTAILQGQNSAITEPTISSLVYCFAIFYGGLAQFMAGMWEFKRQNTFGAAAFSSYGGWWMSFGLYGVLATGGVLPGAGWKGLKMLLALWGIITWIFMIVTLQLNFTIFCLFFSLSVLFWLLAGGEHTSITFTRIAGWWGLSTAGIAFYLAAADMINEQYKRTVLPVGKWAVGVPMAKALKGFMRYVPVLGWYYVRMCDREDRLAGFKAKKDEELPERGDVQRDTGVYGRPGQLHSNVSILPGSWEGEAVYRERQTGDISSVVGPY